MRRLAMLALVGACLACSGCYLENREAMRPTYKDPDVMVSLQQEADTYPDHSFSDF